MPTLLRDSSTAACRSAIVAGTGGSKAAFFGYFLCRGKESNCRPAQGQRVKHGYEIADARHEIMKGAKRSK
ncbi:hypothetical protein PSAB6_30279 [Paraburkholderia sabiae]|nr:hypothetical protein PSAB6_30279 [Paraburkholderia sabiae]